jgi:uncharacterized protein (DUF2237 family)
MTEKNVLGEPLDVCCLAPATGFFRDGYCRPDQYDHGKHVLCTIVTQEFLEYSKIQGNDLMTAIPEYGFLGLHAGDTWCLCVSRWEEAYHAGVAPPVKLSASHEKALTIVTMEMLLSKAIDEKIA